ncbi:hypothetical protein [Piscirickettsia salmonis]|uniref:hypothetical protein n=1 Tax=Piscirickettsia salmonis TaxID=1238 RepID=UPI0012BA71F1|nr:hypothetical protein [Piscirickettsia salmonis]
MLGDFASLDVQNTYRGSDAYVYCFFRTKFRLYLAAKPLVFQILLMSNSRV